jgi:hypothetical protein
VQAVVTEEIRPADQPDTEQFLALVREYDLRHRRLAYRLLGDRDRMDDALQEARRPEGVSLAGYEGRLVIDPNSVPHVWAVAGPLVVTIAGNVSAANLRRIAASMER